MLTYVEYIKLMVATAIPFWCLVTGRHRFLLIWIGGTFGTELLNPSIVVTMTPFSIFGFIFLPFVILNLKAFWAHKIVRLAVSSFLLLGLLGLLYGYWIPWPDTTLVRPLNQRAEGRSLIYTVRAALDLSATLGIAYVLSRSEISPKQLIKYLIFGTSIAAVAVIIEFLLGRDLYILLNPNGRPLNPILEGRFRGINGEPRTSGYLCSLGLVLLIGLRTIRWERYPLLVLHALAFLLTISSTALVTLFAGVSILALSSRRTVMSLTVVVVLCILSLVMVPTLTESQLVYRWTQNVGVRMTRNSMLGPPDNLGEKVANRLEVFDASAVLFFWDNPQYILFGVGPGLISLPASRYVPDYARVVYGDRIDSIPHTGLIQILSDVGVFGLTLWIVVFVLGYFAVRSTSDTSKYGHITSLYLSVGVMYLLQAKPSWFVFLAIAIGAIYEMGDSVASRTPLLRERSNESLHIRPVNSA